MTMEKKKPEIRFNGFEGEWVRHSLNYYLTVSSEKNQEGQYSKYDIYSVSREYGVINQIEYQGKSFAGASLLNYGVVQTEDIVYTKSPLKSQPYGIIKVNSGKSGLVSALYGVFHPQEPVCSYFVQVYFDLDHRLNSYLRPLVNKGAKNTLLISDADALQGEVIFPSRDEQEKLVRFFTTLDKLIAKLEAKLDKLRKLKQALLEKMFVNVNGGGYETPEIRFKGYTNKWQVNNVASIFETYYDKNHPNLPVLSASQEFGMVIRDNVGFQVQHNKENEVGYKRVLPGQFVIHLRSFQGGFAHSMVEGITSPAYTVMQFKNSSTQDDIYWKYVLTSKMFIKRLETVTYGIRDGRSISFEDFSELDFTFPSLSEQEQIGKCFTQIDTHFNKTSTKLTKLRNIKQSLLQKMFA